MGRRKPRERLGRHDPDAEDLAPPARVDDHHHSSRHRDDPPDMAQLHIGGVKPEDGSIALPWPIQESRHPPSIFSQRHEICLFAVPDSPMARARSSNARMETPWMQASCTTAISAIPAIRHGSGKLGKHLLLARGRDAPPDRARARPIAAAGSPSRQIAAQSPAAQSFRRVSHPGLCAPIPAPHTTDILTSISR